jgi:hypothetical protein
MAGGTASDVDAAQQLAGARTEVAAQGAAGQRAGSAAGAIAGDRTGARTGTVRRGLGTLARLFFARQARPFVGLAPRHLLGFLLRQASLLLFGGLAPQCVFGAALLGELLLGSLLFDALLLAALLFDALLFDALLFRALLLGQLLHACLLRPLLFALLFGQLLCALLLGQLFCTLLFGQPLCALLLSQLLLRQLLLRQLLAFAFLRQGLPLLLRTLLGQPARFLGRAPLVLGLLLALRQVLAVARVVGGQALRLLLELAAGCVLGIGAQGRLLGGVTFFAFAFTLQCETFALLRILFLLMRLRRSRLDIRQGHLERIVLVAVLGDDAGVEGIRKPVAARTRSPPHRALGGDRRGRGRGRGRHWRRHWRTRARFGTANRNPATIKTARSR